LGPVHQLQLGREHRGHQQLPGGAPFKRNRWPSGLELTKPGPGSTEPLPRRSGRRGRPGGRSLHLHGRFKLLAPPRALGCVLNDQVRPLRPHQQAGSPTHEGSFWQAALGQGATRAPPQNSNSSRELEPAIEQGQGQGIDHGQVVENCQLVNRFRRLAAARSWPSVWAPHFNGIFGNRPRNHLRRPFSPLTGVDQGGTKAHRWCGPVELRAERCGWVCVISPPVGSWPGRKGPRCHWVQLGRRICGARMPVVVGTGVGG